MQLLRLIDSRLPFAFNIKRWHHPRILLDADVKFSIRGTFQYVNGLFGLAVRRHGLQDELNLRLEGILVETVVPEKCPHHEILDVFSFGLSENENAEWWSLSHMLTQDLFKHFNAFLNLHMLFDHGGLNEVHNA